MSSGLQRRASTKLLSRQVAGTSWRQSCLLEGLGSCWNKPAVAPALPSRWKQPAEAWHKSGRNPEERQLGHQSAILLAAGGLNHVLSSLLHGFSQAFSSKCRSGFWLLSISPQIISGNFIHKHYSSASPTLHTAEIESIKHNIHLLSVEPSGFSLHAHSCASKHSSTYNFTTVSYLPEKLHTRSQWLLPSSSVPSLATTNVLSLSMDSTGLDI